MNSELYDKKYPIPLPIVGKLQSRLMTNKDLTGEGVKRAKFLTKNGYATYQMLKRMKNFFDHFDMNEDSKQEFELSGGEEMRNFIESSLNRDRDGIDRSKELEKPTNPDLMQDFGAPSASVTEALRKDGLINNIDYPKPRRRIPEGEDGYVDDGEELTKNAVAVIYNEENKVLLLKRSSFPDQWMPDKWALVGGGVEEGEDPKDGCVREIKEETGLVVKDISFRAEMKRNPGSVEFIYLASYNGDPFNIKLDKENQGFGWFGENEIDFLDTVPNLMDYINIAIKKYD